MYLIPEDLVGDALDVARADAVDARHGLGERHAPAEGEELPPDLLRRGRGAVHLFQDVQLELRLAAGLNTTESEVLYIYIYYIYILSLDAAFPAECLLPPPQPLPRPQPPATLSTPPLCRSWTASATRPCFGSPTREIRARRAPRPGESSAPQPHPLVRSRCRIYRRRLWTPPIADLLDQWVGPLAFEPEVAGSIPGLAHTRRH